MTDPATPLPVEPAPEPAPGLLPVPIEDVDG
jgi:hypothetical protein